MTFKRIKEFFLGERSSVLESVAPRFCVKPADGIIHTILQEEEEFVGYVPYEWINWAALILGEEQKYFSGHPMTIKSLWILYEGCRLYVESTKTGGNLD